MDLRIAIVQLDIAPTQPELNLQRMEHFVSEAVSRGAQLVVFPEDAVTGPLEGQVLFVANAPAYLAFFQSLALKYGIDIVPGSWTVQEGASLFNASYYINRDGSVAGMYRKINLWETERAIITPGALASVFPTAYGLMGLTMCWDIAFPLLFAEMSRQGAELVISPTLWSLSREAELRKSVAKDEILLIDSLCTARAFENDMVFVYCNAAGDVSDSKKDGALSGRSQITHPQEKVICKASGNAEELLLAHVKHQRAAVSATA
ncbi:MAG: carbon-nitrogen hydrolase family protein [Phycisphaerales bacterium]|nr:carbon-nitrogen hydrolase family protein [Planctomycetota bacterium]MCH8507673.1 carbon-nitrogen hydrolase family protein [Phycisphaerales bacterium]